MVIEGFIMLQHNGALAMYNRELFYELRNGDNLEVDTGGAMIPMAVRRAADGYFLDSKTFSFYPRMVYARFDTNGGKTKGET